MWMSGGKTISLLGEFVEGLDSFDCLFDCLFDWLMYLFIHNSYLVSSNKIFTQEGEPLMIVVSECRSSGGCWLVNVIGDYDDDEEEKKARR